MGHMMRRSLATALLLAGTFGGGVHHVASRTGYDVPVDAYRLPHEPPKKKGRKSCNAAAIKRESKKRKNRRKR